MRHLQTCIMISALIVMAAAAAAHPVPRTVLLETFTNVSCAGCSTANEVTRQFVDDRGNTQVVNVQYHVNWPAADDPFFLAAQPENFVRSLYYEIASAPDLITDGANTPAPGDYDDLGEAIDSRRNVLTPLRIAVTRQLVGSDLTVNVGVKAADAPPTGELKLYVAVVDEHEHFDTPPGNNGETDFHWSMRDLLPDFNGTNLVITEGDSLTFSFQSTVAGDWLDDDLHAVAWVQDSDSHEVWQAATTAPRPAYAADLYAERYGMISPAGILVRMDGWLENTGTEADIYDFHLDVDAPGWQVSACAGSVCHPPWVRDFEVSVDAGAEELIALDFTPSGPGETGVVTVTASSQGDRDLVLVRTFVLTTPGADVLYVDADGSPDYAAYFTNALDAAGATWSAWDVAALGEPLATELDAFTKVVWNAEYAMPGLDETDRSTLGAYLDDGGDLLLSGQDVAFSLCDLNSPYYHPDTKNWYEQYTGAVYVADDAQDSSVTGMADDPVGDGLAFSLAGGDGADNQDYPDELTPKSNARSALDYAPNHSAAVRYALGDARMVTLGFGFEGIATATDRNALMAAVLAWFDDDTVGANNIPAGLALLPGAAAHPNPFNPHTILSFSLAGEGELEASVKLYDVQGRLVRDLWSGPLGPGDHTLRWNGRDDDGGPVAAGAYLAVVKAGDETGSLKMTLVK